MMRGRFRPRKAGRVNTRRAATTLRSRGERVGDVTTRHSYRVPAPVLFVAGGASMYVGAAVAVGLFDDLSPSVVAALRIMAAATVLGVWRRPGRAAWRGRRAGRAAAFGLATAGMNVAFYEAVARLPLGT